MNTQQFMNRFPHHVKAGAGWMVKCPSHEDSTASLAIGEGANGKIVMFCHAGCSTARILEALELTFADLVTESAVASAPPAKTKPAAQQYYDYRNRDGTLVYQVVRMVPKTFRHRRPDGAGGWVWNMQTVKHVPYRFNEIDPTKAVYIVEGEKDVDRLWKEGLQATCNAGGAGKWGATETKALKDIEVHRVIVLPDNDGPGLNHAQDVAKRMKAAGVAVSIIVLPDLPNHGDVSDWLEAGHTIDELNTLVNGTPYLMPKAAVPVPPPSPDPVDIDPATDPSRYRLTDLGGAEAFRDRYGDRLRFDHQRDRWLLWRDHFWEPDADAEAARLVYEHVRTWQLEAVALPAQYDKRAPLVDFTMKLERSFALSNTTTLAKTLLPIATRGSEWDADQWTIGTKNGVVDLRTGAFREGRPEDWITKQTRVCFDAHAACPRWEQFLREVFEDDTDLIHFIHKAIGYSMTADMREQCFFMAVGTGANGKSIFLDTIEYVLADYVHRAPMRLFASAVGEDDRFSMAELSGSRIILAAETKPNTRMNEHVIKALTGGETMQGERKYGNPFTFRPTGKIWLGVNHHPTVADDSFGFWRRVRLIPFNRTFNGSSDDQHLKQRLHTEAEGIFQWALRGVRLWLDEGLTPPQSVLQATQSYESEEDPLTDFLAQCCKINFESVTLFSVIYAEYREWAKEQGLPSRGILSAKALGSNLVRRGFSIAPGTAIRRYKGISIVSKVDRNRGDLFDA